MSSFAFHCNGIWCDSVQAVPQKQITELDPDTGMQHGILLCLDDIRMPNSSGYLLFEPGTLVGQTCLSLQSARIAVLF
jgi:hypothetical protein